MPGNPYLSVLALTKYIKRKFDADPHLRDVYVKGELSNVKFHPSGHIYFTLKDDKARILSVMFKMNAGRMKFRPENGMNVLVRGDVNVYEASGQYQLYVQSMQPDGIGELYLAFEQLKEKLAKEGLFSPQWKQEIPRFPKKIGVITATTGAAIRDICTTLNRRYPLAEILVYPALVQGVQAAPSIVKAIEQADSFGELDVLIVGRGGGSIEDLWAFNEEVVARAIFSAKVPIISAVGHETDTTIADFVADLRAPTPTAAAELAVPSREEILQRIFDHRSRMLSSLNGKLTSEKRRLTRLKESYPLQFPERLYRPFAEKLALLEERLNKNTETSISNGRRKLEGLTIRMAAHSPERQLKVHHQTLKEFSHRLNRAALSTYQKDRNAFTNVLRTLKVLNPLSVMERGFSIVYSDEQVVKSIADLKVSDEVKIQMHDGHAKVAVKSIEHKKEGEL
ncbi:exodeoxyribonuclease VII large subunit [Chungangia koreensis]|uniref:Exodeoxyribonuclease 7 large subunit n=1 Tax=Chungangia koreensis TaxID=752657 RepID=A0ABV8X6I4_9LACT